MWGRRLFARAGAAIIGEKIAAIEPESIERLSFIAYSPAEFETVERATGPYRK